MKKILIIIIAIIILTFFIFADNLPKQVLKKNSKSVVQVINKNKKNYIGSGVVIDKNFIITSSIIINKPPNKLYIVTYDKKKISASLVGMDRESSLALLKVKTDILVPAKINKNIEIGDWVALIGSFYSNFPSIYTGIVSSISDDMLILNAPVAPGLSGGAVVNKNGELVGIIRGGYGFSTSPDYVFKTYKDNLVVKSESLTSGKLCYAIPIKEALNVSEQLRKYGKVKRSFLGVYAKEKNGKIIIEGIVKNSSAEKYGLRKGDIVLEIGKNKIKTFHELIQNIKKITPGQKFVMKVKRDNKIKILNIIMGERKKKYSSENSVETFKKTPFPEISEIPELPNVRKIIIKSFGSKVLGIEVYELTSELAKVYKIKEGKGLLVSKVKKGSAADKGGLKPGDIIVAANGKTVGTVEEIRKTLNMLKDNEKVRIKLYRGKKVMILSILPDKLSDLSYFKNFDKNIKKIKLKIKKLKEDERLKLQIEILRKEMEKLRREFKNNYPDIRKNLKQEIDKLREAMKKLKKELEL